MTNTLLTPGEVAAKLRLSRDHIYRMAACRKIPSIKLGGSLRFELDDIETWIKANKREAVEDWPEKLKNEK